MNSPVHQAIRRIYWFFGPDIGIACHSKFGFGVPGMEANSAQPPISPAWSMVTSSNKDTVSDADRVPWRGVTSVVGFRALRQEAKMHAQRSRRYGHSDVY